MTGLPPPSLLAQQRQFVQGLSGDDPAPALALLRPLRGQPPRLQAYRHAYRARLVEALRNNHPVLHLALGDEAFEALALGYIAAHPSSHRSIRWFGHHLAEYIDQLPDAQAPHPALADLARMEWALGLAFDAADMPLLERSDLAGVAPEQWGQLTLRCHPSVRCLALCWQVEALWRALSGDANGTAPEPTQAKHHLLVWRHGNGPRWRSLGASEATLLQATLGGSSLASLCELAVEHASPEQAPAAVATTLQQWWSDGLLCGLRAIPG